MHDDEQHDGDSPVPQAGLAPRWAGPTFFLLAVALVPWIVYLALTLPSHTETTHYRTAWVGFDVLLVMALGRTAWLALNGNRQVEFSAVVSATLLIVDAWFDIMMSKPGAAQTEAILLALFVELPAAFLALYLSRQVDKVVDRTLQGVSRPRSAFHAGLRRRFSSPVSVGRRTREKESAS